MKSGQRVKRILLNFVWGHTNIGDAAITPGTLVHLQKHFPEAEITLFSSATEGSERYEATSQYLRSFSSCRILPNPFRELARKDPVGFFFQVSRFETESGRFLKSLHETAPEAFQAIFEADLIYYNSGMTLTYNNRGESTSTSTLLTNWSPILLAGALGTPCVLWGQSCGPLDWPADELAREYLPQCLAITTRESESLKFLRDLNAQGPHLAFAPDTTIYFDRRDDAWADAFLKSHGLRPGEFLVAVIRTYGWWGKKLEGERLDRHMERIAAAIDHWVRRTGLPVVIAPECLREIPRAKEFLEPRLKDDIRSRCIVMDEFWLPDQARSLYTHARALLSMELHSIILAMPEGIPVIHPYFEEMGPKTWMLRDAGLEEFLVDIDGDACTERLKALLDDVHENRARIASRVSDAAKAFQATGDEQMARIKALL